MTNVAIVGLGFMAATHIKAYRQVPDARISAICNPSGRNLDGNFANVGGNIGSGDPIQLDMAQVKACRSYSELLSDPDIELIDICSPTPSHHPLAIEALRAGKHVICEKPLARTSQQAREMVEAAAQARRFLMPAMCLRFWPEWAWLKRAIVEGAFGRVLSARFRRVAEPPGWGQKNFFDGKQSGGALLDLHIHDTDFVQFCFGRPTSVFSTGYTQFSGAIDHVVTQYQTAAEAGPIVHAEGGWAMAPGFGFSMSYTVNFEDATVDYDLGRTAEALRVFRKGERPQTIQCEGPDGYVGELSYIIECIRTGQAPSLVTGEDGVSAVEICEAEERSARTGQPVALAA